VHARCGQPDETPTSSGSLAPSWCRSTSLFPVRHCRPNGTPRRAVPPLPQADLDTVDSGNLLQAGRPLDSKGRGRRPPPAQPRPGPPARGGGGRVNFKQVGANKINEIVKIIGLKYKKKYETDEDMWTLRYGKARSVATLATN
jgi:hypothetical protein